MIRLYKLCKQQLRADSGATAIEYGLIAALLVLGIIAAISGAMTASKTMWTKVDTEVAAASN